MKTSKDSCPSSGKRGVRASLPKRALNVALSAVLAVGLMPSLSWAAQDQANATDDQALTAQTVETVTVGQGTTTSSIAPWWPNHYNNESVILYNASDIQSDAGCISSIGFHFYAQSDQIGLNYLRIYMGTTTETSFSSSGTVTLPSDLTLVYEDASGTSALNTNSTGWQTFSFNKANFQWNGSSNIVVVVITDATNEAEETPSVYATDMSSTYASIVNCTEERGTYTTAAAGDSFTGKAVSHNRPDIQLGIELCQHESTTYVSTVAPTCTEVGYDIYHCSICGKDVHKNEAAALGHDYTGVEEFRCKVDGTEYAFGAYVGKHCTRCDYVSVRKYGSPNITKQPVSATYALGDVATALTAEATSPRYFTLSYQWYKDGEAIEGATNYYYQPSTDDKGVFSYYCVVTAEGCEDYPTTSDTATVTVTGYTITTAAEMRTFAEEVNAGDTKKNQTITLTNDITITADDFLAVGSWSANHGFGGTFDGRGHTITLVDATGSSSTTTSVFGYITSTGTVKNLNTAGSLTIGTQYAGGIASTNYGTIQNCTSSMAVKASVDSYYTYAGGIVGRNYGTVSQCATTSDASVEAASASSTANAGGIAGQNHGTVTQCSNAATVTATTKGAYGDAFAGGIVGDNLIGYGEAGGNTVSHCYNTGAVFASKYAKASTHGSACGIVGYQEFCNAGSDAYLLARCYSTGTLSGDETYGIAYNVTSSASAENLVYEDLYFLEGTASAALATTADCTLSNVSVKTADELKASALLAVLNADAMPAVWAAGTKASGGYPILAWQACTHELTETPKVEPTYETAGCKAYWHCAKCDEYFADAEATRGIDDIAAWKAEGGEGYIAPLSVLTVTSVSAITDNAFVSVKNGDAVANLYKVTAEVSVLGEGYEPMLGATAMVKTGEGTYVALVDQATAAAVAAGTLDVTAAKGTAPVLPAVTGDVNLSGAMNIVDAQVAYDMSKGSYAMDDALTMAQFIAADYNADNTVNALDARAIQVAIMS